MSEQHLNFQQAALALASYTSPDQTHIPSSHHRILSWLTDVDANRDLDNLDHCAPSIETEFEYPDSLHDLYQTVKNSTPTHPLADLNNNPRSDPNHCPHVYWDELELMIRFGHDVEVEHHILFLDFLYKSRFFTKVDKQKMSQEASKKLQRRLWELDVLCVINFRWMDYHVSLLHYLLSIYHYNFPSQAYSMSGRPG